jgi:hypothetical protein
VNSRGLRILIAVAAGIFCVKYFLPAAQTASSERAVLFNGWGLSPVGKPIELPGDMPARIVPTTDSRYLFVNSVGFNQHGVFAIDLAAGKVVQQMDLAKSWVGLGLSAHGHDVIAAGGGPIPPEPTYWGVRSGLSSSARERLSFPIYRLRWSAPQLSFDRGIRLPEPGQPVYRRYCGGTERKRSGSGSKPAGGFCGCAVEAWN